MSRQSRRMTEARVRGAADVTAFMTFAIGARTAIDGDANRGASSPVTSGGFMRAEAT